MQPVSWKLKFEEMSPQQLEFVKSMKVFSMENGIEDPWFTLFQVFRFCMARQFQPEEVRKLIVEYSQFRKKHQNMGTFASPCSPVDSELAKATGDGFFCIDKKFRPVFVFRLGAKNVINMLDRFGYEAIEAHYTQMFERYLMIILPICSALKGKRVTKCVTIFDLKDVAITKFLSGRENDFVKNVSQVSQNFFPQILKKVYLINAPMLFETAWKILKIFLHPVTAAKFQIFKGVPSKILQRDIGVENLHRLHSGSRGEDFFTCPGPWASELEFACRTGSLYLKNPNSYLQYFCTEEEREYLSRKFTPQNFFIQRPKTEISIESISELAVPSSDLRCEKALSEGCSRSKITSVDLDQLPQIETAYVKPVRSTTFQVSFKNLKMSS